MFRFNMTRFGIRFCYSTAVDKDSVCHVEDRGNMNAVEILLPALRMLAEAMISLRGHVRFNEHQNAALQQACEVIVQFESGEDREQT
jgi:hypothetical protein